MNDVKRGLLMLTSPQVTTAPRPIAPVWRCCARDINELDVPVVVIIS